MNARVSLSPAPMAHPPRSNPLLRSSSEAPPFPCITPSTETCVVVVSFMIAVPFALGRAPRERPLTPATTTSAPIRRRLADFFRGLSGAPVISVERPPSGSERIRSSPAGRRWMSSWEGWPCIRFLPARAGSGGRRPRWPVPLGGHFGDGRPVRRDGLTVGKQRAGVLEQHDAVAKQAPSLVGVRGHHVGRLAIHCVRRRTGGVMLAHDAPPSSCQVRRPATVADPASAVVVLLRQACRRRWPPSIGISPGSHPGVHPRQHQGRPRSRSGNAGAADVLL